MTLNLIVYLIMFRCPDKCLVQDQKLFTELLSTLLDFILPRELKCCRSWKIWEKIDNHYHACLKAKCRNLDWNLRTQRMVIDPLIAIGETISYQDLIDIVLDGLLVEDYNCFIMVICGCFNFLLSVIESLLMVLQTTTCSFKYYFSNISVNGAHVSQMPQQTNQGNYNFGNYYSYAGNCGLGPLQSSWLEKQT